MVSIERCLTQWFEGFKTYHSLPFYILWGIWRSRNENIFEQTKPNTRDDYLTIFECFMEIWLIKEEQPRRHFRLVELWSYFICLFFVFIFYGASNNGVCGSGTHLVLKPYNTFHFIWYSGTGSNNGVELIIVLGALLCVNWLAIEDLPVFRDSKMILEWVQLRTKFGPPSLNFWMQCIRYLINSFQILASNNVYREQNQGGNLLSKKGFKCLPRRILYSVFDKGICWRC